MAVEFVIEETLDLKGRGAFVFARPVVDQISFRVVPGSTLGGVPVKPYVDMPRRLVPDGSPDLGCFQFELTDAADLRRVITRALVLLEPGQ